MVASLAEFPSSKEFSRIPGIQTKRKRRRPTFDNFDTTTLKELDNKYSVQLFCGGPLISKGTRGDSGERSDEGGDIPE
jgi:hypothetical protein